MQIKCDDRQKMNTLNAIKRSNLVSGPVRRIGVQSRSITGTMPNGNRYESALERDFMILMQFDAAVDVYTPQPLTLNYVDETGKARRYTPDGLIEWRRDRPVHDPRPVLVEIKYREDFKGKWREWRARARAAKKLAHENGWIFSIQTERDIRTPLLETATFLLPYLRRSEAPEIEEWMLNRLADLVEATPRELCESLYQNKRNQAALISVMWRLLAERRIGFDVAQPLTMSATIWSLKA